MHRTYVGPTSARCRQTPADIPPSSRYRPDVGMFAGMFLCTMFLKKAHNSVKNEWIVTQIKLDLCFDIIYQHAKYKSN